MTYLKNFPLYFFMYLSLSVIGVLNVRRCKKCIIKGFAALFLKVHHKGFCGTFFKSAS